MPHFLRLRGRSALSTFRRNRLEQRLSNEVAGIRVEAEFWHFLLLSAELNPAQAARLDRVLAYGPARRAAAGSGELVLVVPRLGTISPWSSKATDIARHCGLDSVLRLERGIAYWLTTASGARLTAAEKSVVIPHLHDRMTETVLPDLDAAGRLFLAVAPRAFETVEVLRGGIAALVQANSALGLALSDDEIAYLDKSFSAMGRNPTDVELMMFAQANSEHCRHKIFNAGWIVDGEPQPQSLFGMIRNTHQRQPRGTVVAYSDNAAIIEGCEVERFYTGGNGDYAYHEDLAHILIKVETHNHPTAISPYPGAATGSGGEIRDEGATGRGAKPKAGLTGFSVSHLRIPGFVQPWEQGDGCRPARIASPLAIMIEGPVGGASFNNEFGRPNLCGYFRTFEQTVAGESRGYHKPIMVAGGLGNIAARHAAKLGFGAGTLLVQLGGPGMLIGVGGGAASSMDTGSNQEELDFGSVQRGNAEIQRRAQEVIDRCWELGEGNPILSIHDVGAGGLSNALPELVHAAGCGARFELRDIPSEDPGMSPLQIWCNEAQERYVLAIAPEHIDQFAALCRRERCPFAVVGRATEEGRLVVGDSRLGNNPVDMELSVLLGKPPRMTRDVARRRPDLTAFDVSRIPLADAAFRVLRLPAVADKTFLITIGDRTVGGLTARDQMVGPWQVPVADVAVTLAGFRTYRGEAYSMGERTPLALIDAPASGRMAIAEALTNLAAAPVADLADIKLSANWMAAAGHPGEDAALYDTVRAVALEFCPQLGLSIPVGKDSLSMKTAWSEAGARREVVAPLSLIVSAFAPCTDVRRVLTPQLRTDCGDSVLVLLDLAGGRCRLGGSALAQVHGEFGDCAPDIDDVAVLRKFFIIIQLLNKDGRVLSYHDRSDGGLFVTLCEMMFAGRVGISVDRYDAMASTDHARVMALLFNEEAGAVLQVRASDLNRVREACESAGLGVCFHVLGGLNPEDRLVIRSGGNDLFAATRVELQRAWSETTFHLQRLRDHPDCAREEYDRVLDAADPGLHAHLTFQADTDIAAPFINTGARPRVAILREQGVNGQVEMAAAFDRAGFAAHDVHMSDIIDGRSELGGYAGIAACGGFSYGDVLGAGEGWAKSILFNTRARNQFASFFGRGDVFALGVCNGCQMMSNLSELIPGAADWPHFVRNRSEQFEARFCLVEVQDSRSLFFRNMAGSRIPIAVSHGEGYAEFADADARLRAASQVALRYVDHSGAVTETYPYNPNGSPQGVAGLTTPDGRYTILMPHPERVFRTVQNSWHPETWGEDGAWLRMFRNARKWLG